MPDSNSQENNKCTLYAGSVVSKMWSTNAVRSRKASSTDARSTTIRVSYSFKTLKTSSDASLKNHLEIHIMFNFDKFFEKFYLKILKLQQF